MEKISPVDIASYHLEFRSALIAFFLRRVRNYSEAEDLTQEVFLRISKGPAAGMKSPAAYIFQVAANLLSDRARADKTRRDHAAAAALVEGAGVDALDPHRVAAGREALARLNAALAELPERTRQIFLLFRYEGIDQGTIAESFSISVSAVEKHVYRAMAKLIQSKES